jgi:hypothetical protein
MSSTSRYRRTATTSASADGTPSRRGPPAAGPRAADTVDLPGAEERCRTGEDDMKNRARPASFRIGLAQVHATLAVAEQLARKRIAGPLNGYLAEACSGSRLRPRPPRSCHFVPKPGSQVVALADTVPGLLVNVRQRPPVSGHVHAGCHPVSHSVRTNPAARRHAGSPVARIVTTKSRSRPVRSSSPIRTARSLVWMM